MGIVERTGRRRTLCLAHSGIADTFSALHKRNAPCLSHLPHDDHRSHPFCHHTLPGHTPSLWFLCYGSSFGCGMLGHANLAKPRCSAAKFGRRCHHWRHFFFTSQLHLLARFAPRRPLLHAQLFGPHRVGQFDWLSAIDMDRLCHCYHN